METRQTKQVSELRFVVYNRPLHPELFEIYHNHEIVKDRYEARIWVTGLGHVISFYRQDAMLCEVITETSTMLPHRGKLMSVAFRGERDEELTQAEGIHYLTSFQVETMSPRLYAEVHRDLSLSGTDRGLFVPFPEWVGNSLTPFTFIDYEAKVGQLHVFTYHAFSEEMTLIKTQSIFEIA